MSTISSIAQLTFPPPSHFLNLGEYCIELYMASEIKPAHLFYYLSIDDDISGLMTSPAVSIPVAVKHMFSGMIRLAHL